SRAMHAEQKLSIPLHHLTTASKFHLHPNAQLPSLHRMTPVAPRLKARKYLALYPSSHHFPDCESGPSFDPDHQSCVRLRQATLLCKHSDDPDSSRCFQMLSIEIGWPLSWMTHHRKREHTASTPVHRSFPLPPPILYPENLQRLRSHRFYFQLLHL